MLQSRVFSARLYSFLMTLSWSAGFSVQFLKSREAKWEWKKLKIHAEYFHSWDTKRLKNGNVCLFWVYEKAVRAEVNSRVIYSALKLTKMKDWVSNKRIKKLNFIFKHIQNWLKNASINTTLGKSALRIEHIWKNPQVTQNILILVIMYTCLIAFLS